MDCVGMGEITRMLAKTLSSEALSNTELAHGNQPRDHAIPLFGTAYQPPLGPGTELDDVYLKPTSFSTPAGFANIDMTSPPRWVYLNFLPASLHRLKADATHQGLDPNIPYLTTDDALCALLWQHVHQARHARLGSAYPTRLGRVVNVRKCFGLDGYLGNMGDTVEYLDDGAGGGICKKPLGAVASRLRAGLQGTQYAGAIKHHMQALATMLDRYQGEEEKSKLGFGANIDFNKDLYMSSYTKVFPCCEWSFGPLLGVPEAGRRPQLANSALPGLFMFMPRSKTGDLAVAAALSEVDIAALRQDEIFMSYAEFLD